MFEKLLKLAQMEEEEKKAAAPEKKDEAPAAGDETAEEKTAPAPGNGNGARGLKETTEVIEALTMVTVFLTKRLKDGIGADDAMALMEKLTTDEEFVNVIARAADGISEIPAELSDLDFEESLTLGILGLGFIKEVVGALKEDG
ncbi:hypothetical protein EPICR_140014 [Candidatus Desulfarcum epimagneticum]|uniref:Uncharacterized protein n=1 Tax=uncultured Desulfobacteraceae bacterium TaxID=218296 RepID=A0A484HEV8_9BACT|nr:hypothetical protein EPICR_140014 [uncultured Desulfobacteraceae bacterium]